MQTRSLKSISHGNFDPIASIALESGFIITLALLPYLLQRYSHTVMRDLPKQSALEIPHGEKEAKVMIFMIIDPHWPAAS